MRLFAYRCAVPLLALLATLHCGREADVSHPPAPVVVVASLSAEDRAALQSYLATL